MQNSTTWKPSKYMYRKGHLIASRDPKEVGISSRLLADRIAAFYDQTLRHHARGKLLDLGCGKVPLYTTYREFVTENICVDWANTAHKNEYLDFELDLTQPLPFPDQTFDTILLSDVLEHIPVPEQLWHEMARLLTPQGKIILNVPFFYWLHEMPFDYYRYTEFALRRFVDLAGLTLIHLAPIGGVPEVMTDIFAKTVAPLPGLGGVLATLAQGITTGFIRTGIGKKVSAKTARRFPLGYFLIAEKVPLEKPGQISEV